MSERDEDPKVWRGRSYDAVRRAEKAEARVAEIDARDDDLLALYSQAKARAIKAEDRVAELERENQELQDRLVLSGPHTIETRPMTADEQAALDAAGET